jgi:hypothetical protein
MPAPCELNGETEGTELIGAALASLRLSGAVVIRKSFDWRQVLPLLENTERHADLVAHSVQAGTPLNFSPSYRWLERGLACDISAIDPNTCDCASDDFNKTTLCAAVMNAHTQAILRAEIGDDAGYALVRLRTILPGTHLTGSLPLHKEITNVRFPGVHVVWTPLIPPKLVTNVEVPGLQFRCNDGAMYQPTLQAGDIVIFNGEIEHGTYIPEGVTHWRCGCDIRVFPWTTENMLPANAITMGYGPRRLNWPKLPNVSGRPEHGPTRTVLE